MFGNTDGVSARRVHDEDTAARSGDHIHVVYSDTGAAYVFASPGPALSKLKESHRSWLLGGHAARTNPAHPRAGGTRFSFSLTQAATVSLAFTEKVGKRTEHKGTLKVTAALGANTVYFDGKIGAGKKLVPGRCTVTIVAKDGNGSSLAKHLKFRVHARKAH